ncbi:MAG: DUF2760 domain-containing protein [Myxococcales bacterium]|nr:DUF2760 domain-containing protein [Myxococcales bacterium]
MANSNPSIFARFFLAIAAYFRVLFDGDFAASVVKLRAGALPADASPGAASERGVPPEPPSAPEPRVERAPADAAMQLLGLLQREGRFIDFLREDVSAYPDADIGAAARVVHEGCKRAIDEHFTLEPVRAEAEGSRVTLDRGFDARAIQLTGQVAGEPPFTGTLQHRGWRVREAKLPKLTETHDVTVLAPAEVEL